MKRVTRNIDPMEARDLLERVPRACVAFGGDHGPQVEPVAVVFRNARYLVGLPVDGTGRPTVGDEVVLLIDEGVHFFDLRAMYIRGRVGPVDLREGLPEDCSWFAVEPTRTVAWDYGRMREVDDES